ncbi:MAG: PAS domain S-box protein [Balneolaceae bacterium]|nr:MAG: PAS domain S-box protein [Balneolaceae bacterium]
MKNLLKNLNILVIEDNPGDFVLIEEYLTDELEHPNIHHATTFAEAKQMLGNTSLYQAILLDLTLPDNYGENLVHDVVSIAKGVPIIVFTGYENRKFGLQVLSYGIADYLLKDEMSPYVLGKSISYSIERNRINSSLRNSEKAYRDFFNLSPLPIYVYDIETLKFVDVNKAAIEHYGYSREEFLSLTLRDIRPKEDLTDYEQIMLDFNNSNSNYFEGVFRHQKKNGTIIDVRLKTNVFDQNGKRARLALVNDITKQLQAERELVWSEQRFKSLVQDGSDLIAILDYKLNITYVSANSEIIIGIPDEVFIGKNVFEYIHPEDVIRLKNTFRDFRFKDRFEVEPFRFKNADGNWRWFETIITNLTKNPAIRGYIANSRDITEKIDRELQLKESLERYDIVSKATSDTIWDMDLQTDTMLYNENIYINFGYKRTEVHSVTNWWRHLIHPNDRYYVNQRFREAIANRKDRFKLEYRFKAANGSYKHIYDRAFLIKDSSGEPIRIIGAMQDITQLVEEQEQLKLLESVVTNTNDTVVITEAAAKVENGRKVLFVNQAFTNLTGYTSEEISGQSLQVFVGPETDPKVLKKVLKSLDNYTPVNEEIKLYKKDGSPFWAKVSYLPVYDKNEVCTHWIAIAHDITVMKEKENELLDSLREKETLLSEIHHRVKNNLAIVTSLMEFQAINSDNEIVHDSLINSSLRIQSMAEIHEQLYQSSSFSKLKFSESLKKLITKIVKTLRVKTDVALQFEMENVELTINQGVPCSLLVNEVITNILKHGFVGRKSGVIKVMLECKQNEVSLLIKDNGIGLPADFQKNNTSSMGLKLINLLTDQIGGKNNFYSDKSGTTFELNFQKTAAKGASSALL